MADSWQSKENAEREVSNSELYSRSSSSDSDVISEHEDYIPTRTRYLVMEDAFYPFLKCSGYKTWNVFTKAKSGRTFMPMKYLDNIASNRKPIISADAV